MDAVEEVKSRLAIEDVISEYVQLKRAGRNYKGLSPFSAEKTPSFMVSPEKQIWHDFSSGKGGDMFSLVMELEGLDFKGALEHLARKAGVDLAQYQTGRSADFGKVKERLYEAHELAAKFYQAQFRQHKTALTYIFEKRKFTKEVALAFRLGYSPNTGTALLDFLQKKGFTEQELGKAGLITKRYRGAGDMFRGRIQIPLMDPQGRVIGFTARLLVDDPGAPKYLNTPQTLLYDKGRHVYGLHLAKEDIRKSGYVVVTEGNLDVIASHQAGISQVVATAGTAMTEMHLKALNRFTGDIRLAFDQDKAGLAAAERAIPLAGRVGVTLSMITVPEGKDPDELIKKNPKVWQTVIETNQYALDWLMDRYAAQLDLGTAVGKRQFSDVTLRVVRQLPDEVEQDHYLGEIAKRSGIGREALEQKLRSGGAADSTRLKKPKVEHKLDPMQIDRAKTQNQFLCLMLMQPALRHYLKPLTTDMFSDDRAQQLLGFLQENPKFNGDHQEASPLNGIADYVKILGLQFDELYRQHELLELRNEAAHLQAKLIKQYVQIKKQPITRALATAGEPERTRLLEQAKELDKLLKRL
ncbi:MAG TPA: DNA primase [Candidatus Limnocylindria bacterium]|nr:DNA primase [Candidatus Limnocylindria bacterium]